MKIKLITNLEQYNQWKKLNQPGNIGLVPTMGNLHDAHLKLLKRSLKENEISILTIFVNPLQFGEGEDFSNYPRTLKADLKKVKTLAKTIKDKAKQIIIFAPESEKVIFPIKYKKKIKAGPLGKILEGRFRPTHFDGVTTVVYRLFKIFKPDNAYFGQKDYQQLVIVQQMAKKFHFKTRINPIEIGREHSGLAMSSRNKYLKPSEKKEALILRRSILKIKKVLKEKGIKPALELSKKIMERDDRFNYLELKNAQSLKNINKKTKNIVIVGTLQIGKTRLLDNEVIKYDGL